MDITSEFLSHVGGVSGPGPREGRTTSGPAADLSLKAFLARAKEVVSR